MLGDLVIDVPGEVAVNRQVVRKRAETRAIAADPATRLVTVSVPPPDMEHPLGDADRLIAAIEATGQWRGVWLDPPLLTEVQRGAARGRLDRDRGRAPGHRSAAGHRALAGARTRRCSGSRSTSARPPSPAIWWTSRAGRAVASAGTTNPQIRFGEDLMSRISYLMLNPDDRGALTGAVRGAIGGADHAALPDRPTSPEEECWRRCSSAIR